jgi:dihydroxyacetone kinase-like protein
LTALVAVIRDVAEAVRARADELNRLDGEAGDGDLGVTMSTAATILVGLLPGLEGKPISEILSTCGSALARGAPSTSGTLVATAFLRAGRAAREPVTGNDAEAFARLLDAARSGIAERGKAEPGSKTMLDALIPASEAAATAARDGTDVAQAIERAAVAADRGARATTTMRPRHGRAGWLAERSAGHEDAGARLVAIALAAAARSAAQARHVPTDP